MHLFSLLPHLWSFRNVVILSILLRVVLILYGEWHDARSYVKYTDVDYRVFSDAAGFVLRPSDQNHAQGPLKSPLSSLGDPYTRETYRYTPLLALLLTPNEFVHPCFGKVLFASCDIANGLLIFKLLVSVILPHSPGFKKVNNDEIQRYATAYSAVHLLNPMVFSISTRGSSESVLCFFVLSTLYAALKDKWTVAAMLLGVSTHWKIYPVIYGASCLGVVGRGGLLNRRTVKFGLLGAWTFGVLGLSCYAIWGYPFLYESYLYHLHRLDHRHNFSPYFYLTYLTYPPANFPPVVPLLRSPMTSFVPQMLLSIGIGLLFGRKKEDLPFAWFVQTSVFVALNKVCTSQYFLWYLLLLPLIMPQLHISKAWSLIYMAIWVATQALWLAEAYNLEFLGRNVFFGLWIRSLIYVVGNCFVLAGIIQSYRVEA